MRQVSAVTVNILLGYYILTYGGDRRSIEILDLFTFKFKGKALRAIYL